MNEQISLLPQVMDGEDIEELKYQVELFHEYAKKKRNWENAFQRWSNAQGIEAETNTTGYGCCGYGSMCEWCEDNTYGRPCVRALNKMCREKNIALDYTDYNFERIW